MDIVKHEVNLATNTARSMHEQGLLAVTKQARAVNQGLWQVAKCVASSACNKIFSAARDSFYLLMNIL